MSEVIGPAEWYQAFRREVRKFCWAEPLRESALKNRLGNWTEHLTGVVVATCQSLGWEAVARGYLAEVLPVPKQEYLAVDVMASPSVNRPAGGSPLQFLNWRTGWTWKPSLIQCGR